MQVAFTSFLLYWVKIWDSEMFAVYLLSFPDSHCCPGSISHLHVPAPLQHSQVSPCFHLALQFLASLMEEDVCMLMLSEFSLHCGLFFVKFLLKSNSLHEDYKPTNMLSSHLLL